MSTIKSNLSCTLKAFITGRKRQTVIEQLCHILLIKLNVCPQAFEKIIFGTPELYS